MSAWRSAIDRSGRGRNSTTCAITGGVPLKTVRATETVAWVVRCGLVPRARVAERWAARVVAVALVRAPRWAAARDSVLGAVAAVSVPPYPDRATRACDFFRQPVVAPTALSASRR